MTIEIHPWSRSWPKAFEDAAAQIRTTLGRSAVVEHVGSTAVGGLAAKPILDVLIGFTDEHALAEASQRLEDDGWERGKPAGSVTAFLSKPAVDEALGLNAHLAVIHDQAWTDLLTFRDWLRLHPEQARAYVDFKRELVAAWRSDLDAYTSGKSPFVREVLVTARTVDTTLRYQRHALGQAVVLRCTSIVLQLSIAGSAMLSVLSTSRETLVVLAGMTLLLGFAWLASDRRCREFLSNGEQARRLIQVEYGLGHRVSERSLIAEAFPPPAASVKTYTIGANFATRAPPGMRRLAEMIDESAFFGAAIQKASATVTWAFLIAVSVGAFVGFLFLGPRVEDSLLTTAILIFMAFAVFLLSADVIGGAMRHGRAGAEMEKIRLRLSAARGRQFPEGDVLQAMIDYNSAVDGAPPPLPFVYEAISADLSRRWDVHKAHASIGEERSAAGSEGPLPDRA